MENFSLGEFLLNNGIGVAIAVVLLIRMIKREDKLEKKIAEHEKFQRETLLTLVAENREQITENTAALKNANPDH